ncbi:type II toxin-antitoxin system HicB family antitoxin [Lentilactobacillus raoultii]|uniref:Type II toxin-antitoxin system HicB family antitoxin n=1 Tax=Lentilactobacillus raoultii TaxID=1987503 RepID=A0ABW3PKM0_9LACO|nr:type II toxin-antitoxin system HicB family antitoxin [Lentilactobacillus raoultii]
MAKKDTVVYPAIFEPDTKVDAINVTFPDVPEAITYGRNEEEAAYYANDALGLALVSRGNLPKASSVKDVKLSKDQYVVLIAVDLEEAKRKIRKPTIRKNTTIPADLNEEAQKAGINFSEVLTDALRERLHE